MRNARPQIAILDDYIGGALELADWSRVQTLADLTVFSDHLADPQALIERLQPFDAVCVMRERTPLPRAVIERLPKLKLIASTGWGNASIDMDAARDHGVSVTHTDYIINTTVEFTWALILALSKNITTEHASMRAGGWQVSVGTFLEGKTLGVLGLGRLGSRIAAIAPAFGLEVIAWSENLTAEAAAEKGARLVSKDELFRQSDILTIHMILSERSRGLVGATELALMKPSARLINTSRGPIVVEADLVAALREKRIAGAALDVFDIEPLPVDHPYRTIENLLLTPHIGYATQELYSLFYREVAQHVLAWLEPAETAPK
jgi:phosphoglycerate dehydrogenase-like enzyme